MSCNFDHIVMSYLAMTWHIIYIYIHIIIYILYIYIRWNQLVNEKFSICSKVVNSCHFRHVWLFFSILTSVSLVLLLIWQREHNYDFGWNVERKTTVQRNSWLSNGCTHIQLILFYALFITAYIFQALLKIRNPKIGSNRPPIIAFPSYVFISLIKISGCGGTEIIQIYSVIQRNTIGIFRT